MNHPELDFSNPVLIINESQEPRFQSLCKKAIEEGYVLDSSSCGFVDSQEYDYCSAYHAIFIRKWALSTNIKEVK